MLLANVMKTRRFEHSTQSGVTKNIARPPAGSESRSSSTRSATAHITMAFMCPCPTSSATKLVEMSPFRDAGSGSDEDQPPPTLADKAKGWLSVAAAPLQSFQESRARAAAKQEKIDVLKAGCSMKLLPDGRGNPENVRVTLSPDSTMLTWSGAGGSGVMALSAVRDVKPVLQTGFLASLGSGRQPVPCQWLLGADDQTVRFEAPTEDVKVHWMDTLEQLVAEQIENKSDRKLMHQAKRRLGLEEKRRDAERRKAEGAPADLDRRPHGRPIPCSPPCPLTQRSMDRNHAPQS